MIKCSLPAQLRLYKIWPVFLFVLISFPIDRTLAQETRTAEELFLNARNLAFEDKNYPAAIALTKQALFKSPEYADIQIFLGRLYSWTKEPDSARVIFMDLLKKDPGNEDASLAFGSLEYWAHNSEKALIVVSEGLQYHEKSEGLLLLKTKVLVELQRYKDANSTLSLLLNINPNHSEARALSGKIGDFSFNNKIGLSYDYVYFDKQFNDPWHLISIDYGRQMGLGSVNARINFANRFAIRGTQFELDIYPRISKVLYAYMSAGYSKSSIFPEFRTGFSLYANLPSAFEIEAGFRMLKFNEPTWIYTASVGKYFKNYWFNLKTFLTPFNNSVSQSLSLSSRYYFGAADDYLSLTLGTGLSPDNQRNNILYNSTSSYKLKSNNVSLGFHKSIKTSNVIFLNGSLENQEYLQNTRGNQYVISAGYMKRF